MPAYPLEPHPRGDHEVHVLYVAAVGVPAILAPKSEAATQAGELRAARAVRLKLDSFVAAVTGQPGPAIPG